MQKYITVSQAIRKARNTVVYPALIAMMLIMATAVFILASFENSLLLIILSIILMLSSFVAFGTIMTILGDKWKTWAYKYVDDVKEFRERAPNNRFSVNIFPSRWHLSIKKERLKALNIVRERIQNNTLKVILEYDYSTPRKLEIKRSLFYYLAPLVACIWACYKTSGRLIHGTSAEFMIDMIFFLFSSAGIVFLLLKLIQHPTLVIITEEGIWSKRTGFQPWDMVDSFGFQDKAISNTNTGSHMTTSLHITFKPASGLEKKKSVIKHDIAYLNKKATTIEKTMKVHYQRYTHKRY